MRPEPPPPDCQQHYLRGGLWSRGAYSLNYERVLFRALKERLMLSASFGASYYSKPYYLQYYHFAERLNLTFGYKGVFLELGCDLILSRSRTYSFRDYWLGWSNTGTVLPHAGLRYQRKSAAPFFKVYLLPIRNNNENYFLLYHIKKASSASYWYLWGGLALGYTF